MQNEKISLPIYGHFTVLEELQRGSNLLFFYDRDIEARQIFQSNLHTGLKNEQVCFCAFDKNNKWIDERYCEENKNKAIVFPLTYRKQEDTFSLNDIMSQIDSLEKYAKNGLTQFKLMIDFGNLFEDENIDTAVKCENQIIRKINEFERRYRLHRSTYKKNYYISSAVTGFNINSLDVNSVNRLLTIPKKIAIFLKDSPKMILPNFVINRGLNPAASVDSITHKSMEMFVKNNIQMIILKLLKERPMSGYDIIKNIAIKFHVYLNQGNVYPLLYSFKSKGTLRVKLKSDNRTKQYFITEDTKKDVNNKLEDFKKTLDYFACV